MNQERTLMLSPSESSVLQRVDYQRQKEKLLLLEKTAAWEGVRKRCFKCKREKPIEQFYKHPQMGDGHLGKCKTCTKRDVSDRYESPEGRERVRAYEKMRVGFQERKANRIGYDKRYDERYPEKKLARQAVANAIRCNRLIRLPCDVCGDPKSQAHHDDYRKPLSVRWLCFKHHCEQHGKIAGPII